MVNQEIEAIAISFEELRAGPDKGKQPIVVFTEEGLSGAGLKGSLPKVPMVHNGEIESEHPKYFSNASSGGNVKPNAIPHEIQEVCFAVDRSGSMAEPLVSSHHESKFSHVVRKILSLAQRDELQQAATTLITFNNEAVSFDALDIRGLAEQLQKTIPTGGTSFHKALSLVLSRFGQDTSSRKLLVFVSDGQDRSSPDTVAQIAKDIRETNAACFIAGVGADYDIHTLLQIAGNVGFSGWAHTPMPNTAANVFELYLPEFMSQIANSDDYIQVTANDRVDTLWAVTPSVRPVLDEKKLTFGYLQRGIGVCFARKADDAELTLLSGSRINDPLVSSESIQIIPSQDAGNHFEKLTKGREAIVQVELLQAMLSKDIRALGELAKEYPVISQEVDTFIRNSILADPDDEATKMRDRSTMSRLGNTVTSRVNDWSRVPGNAGNLSSPFQSLSLPKESFSGHSGGLAPLDAPLAGEIAPLGTPDAAKYNNIAPREQAILKIVSSISVSALEYDLSKLTVEKNVIVGRHPDCDFVVSIPEISRSHFKIFRGSDMGFYIQDLGSRNGTQVNRTILNKIPLKLVNGDCIRVGSVTLEVTLPS